MNGYQLFGLVDFVVLGGVAVALMIGIIASIPTIVRHMKIHSM